jgi:16S rRNA C1402 (ribose-2'-O) methylase RsmI
LTKLHEEIYRGDAASALEHFTAPRGEITLVIGGAGLSAAAYWTPPQEAAPETPAGRYRRPRAPRPKQEG